MPNTLDSINETRELVDHLINKTLAKKLDWTLAKREFAQVSYPEDPSDVFEVSLGSEFTVQIYSFEKRSTGEGYGVKTRDKDTDLLRVELDTNPRFGYSLPGEAELASELARLHELARRSVFGIDTKLNQVKNLLMAL
jgi:hypothetical protein